MSVPERVKIIRERHKALKAEAEMLAAKVEGSSANGSHRKFREEDSDSTAGILILAASQLGQPFTLSQLVRQCWLINKDLFGLKDFEDQHPCSRRVAAVLYGSKGVIASGSIRKLSDGRMMVSSSSQEEKDA